MVRTVGIGIQDFETVIENDYFYIDKTNFIKEWWESGFGRYDVMLESKKKDDYIIIEFKVFNPKRDETSEDTVIAAKSRSKKKDMRKP